MSRLRNLGVEAEELSDEIRELEAELLQKDKSIDEIVACINLILDELDQKNKEREEILNELDLLESQQKNSDFERDRI